MSERPIPPLTATQDCRIVPAVANFVACYFFPFAAFSLARAPPKMPAIA